MSTTEYKVNFDGKLILPKNRKCSDILCLVVFGLSIGCFLFFTVWGANKGNVNEIFYSLDSAGFYCGVDSRQDYPYMYRPTPVGDGLYYQICVQECPKDWQQNVSCFTNSYVKDCNFWNLERGQQFYNITSEVANLTQDLPLTYPTKLDWKNQNCAENPSKQEQKFFPNRKPNSGNTLEDIFEEFGRSYLVVLIVFGLAVALSLLFLFSIKTCGGCFI